MWRNDWGVEGGQLLVLGRSDGQLKVRGRRVEAGEIENALMASPLLVQAAAALCEDGRLGALVVARDDVWREISGGVGSGMGVDADGGDKQPAAPPLVHARLSLAIRARCQELVPAFMVPSVICVVQASTGLPTTRTNKLARGRLSGLLSMACKMSKEQKSGVLALKRVAVGVDVGVGEGEGRGEGRGAADQPDELEVGEDWRANDDAGAGLFSDASVAAVWEQALGLQEGEWPRPP